MEQTFMTIHNLSADANVLFASESVVDILGYQPSEVQGKPAFEFFHPQELPFARSVHRKGVLLDKAAVLHYARILASDGRWVSCECCFTVVHDVLVASTSVYRRGAKSERRAIEAPQIRRIFSSSPRDPRYNMLEHLSPKFKMPPMEREPRAALILNRFTRNLTVMFATNAIAQLLGLRPEEIKDKSFYQCIQQNCLADAIRCLESAKSNDSIAYLRFWYRDPREQDENMDEDGEVEVDEEEDEDMEGGINQDDDDDDSRMDIDSVIIKREPSSPSPFAATPSPAGPSHRCRSRTNSPESPSIELEAVVSCTSDGLVVVLRKARPPIPAPHPPLVNPFDFENGLFAAPWGQQPIRPYYPPETLYTFRPPLLPEFMPVRENVKAAGGPPLDQLMHSIRDVAVFAWAVVGMNGTMANFAQGLPRGEAEPVQRQQQQHQLQQQQRWDDHAAHVHLPQVSCLAPVESQSRKIESSPPYQAVGFPAGVGAAAPEAQGYGPPAPPAIPQHQENYALMRTSQPAQQQPPQWGAYSPPPSQQRQQQQQQQFEQSPAPLHRPPAGFGQVREPWAEAARGYTAAEGQRYPVPAASRPREGRENSTFRPW